MVDGGLMMVVYPPSRKFIIFSKKAPNLKLQSALSLAIKVLSEKRRKYAPEAYAYEHGIPEFESEYREWKKLDEAISEIKAFSNQSTIPEIIKK